MTREHVLMILGVLVFLSPWSGIPMVWLEWILLALGLSIVAIASMMHRRRTLAGDIPVSHMPPTTVLPAAADEPRSRSSNIAFS